MAFMMTVGAAFAASRQLKVVANETTARFIFGLKLGQEVVTSSTPNAVVSEEGEGGEVEGVAV